VEDEDLPMVYSPDRFEIEMGHHLWVWVMDHSIDSRYRLSFQEMMEDEFDPACWLEGVFRPCLMDNECEGCSGKKGDPDLDEEPHAMNITDNQDSSDQLELEASSEAKTIPNLQRNAARTKEQFRSPL
jgi:hypothetical protein